MIVQDCRDGLGIFMFLVSNFKKELQLALDSKQSDHTANILRVFLQCSELRELTCAARLS